MPKKRALITGISGQDGAYLANFLLQKDYEVIGGERQNASGTLWRLEELGIEKKIKVIPFELLEENNINDVVRKGKFNEIYNLAAQSFVGNSYSSPIFTSNVNALGVTRILEAIRHFSNKTKFYQASTSEMYGNVISNNQDESTSFKPISPYAISKLYAHWMVNLYREAYDIFCCSGILFNHESPLRGAEFVTKKIIQDLARIKNDKISYLKLGNIYSKRDWGYSKDYVGAMWKMLQLKKADDFVISSGKTYTVKEFVNRAAKNFDFDLTWHGNGINEKAIDKKTKKTIVKIDKNYFRPTEVNYLYGNSKKAKKVLKWSPKTDIDELIRIMCDYEKNKFV
mgnify:CR=1 FL=1|tara:strand:- start:4068 stop:5087 length:1020 start_codon:yes stop_codon:yes gene_type:complete